ncbi:hypothetical protein SAMD00023353_1301580 [Rosellinia necatrix]|uniref:Uncharacterized protein n=1 Tax=Rosellinia necatrix TaxID=77044 RepID=A0A1S8A6X8_ROSNE|nr:hypothetical protein SAMD00023353_1301580 [Rosellinia necatrix]
MMAFRDVSCVSIERIMITFPLIDHIIGPWLGLGDDARPSPTAIADVNADKPALLPT